MKKTITLIIVAIVVSLTIITIFNLIPTQNLDNELANDFQTIIDYSISQSGVLDLSITTSSSIPQNLLDMALVESEIGFGYAWFWDDSGIGGHPGPGHLKGYIVSNPIDNVQQQWRIKSTLVEVLFTKELNVDFCLSDIEDVGEANIADNTISAQIPLQYVIVRDSVLAQIISFKLIQNSLCHSGFGGKIHHNFEFEN
ncbi:MAG: hypothetical protein FJ360_02595 [Thaumarchaeota archaeon]|nr:hypothetical protein [Nitrososphaerota archaeon]